jgi:leucyl aminopeptidase
MQRALSAPILCARALTVVRVPRMDFSSTAATPTDTGADTIAIGICADEGIAHDVPDGSLGALLASGEARGAARSVAVTHAAGRRWLIVGLGERDRLDGEAARVAAATAHARALELGAATLCWEVPHGAGDDFVAGLVEGTALHAYRFDRFKPHQDSDRRPLERLILSADRDVSDIVQRAGTVATAQNRARDLVNMPANVMTPTALADYARELGERFPAISVTVHDEAWIRDAGMGAFAAIAQGSVEDARLISLRYKSIDAGPRIGLVGKAVTFDLGGLSIKTAEPVWEMKYDMAGGAAVIETVAALAESGAPADVLALVGATENMVGPHASRPGDIITALDGTTIETDNMDAEGRLVMADLLTYARRQGRDHLVDIATLSGDVVAALGPIYAGLYCNDEPLADAIQRAAGESGELVWRLPLHPAYARMTAGRDAVLTNRPVPRVALGSSAAELLHHFAGDTPWAHLDIAGLGWNAPSDYITDTGPTGFGVRLFVEWISSMSS